VSRCLELFYYVVVILYVLLPFVPTSTNKMAYDCDARLVELPVPKLS
jgi:hypothetical protein